MLIKQRLLFMIMSMLFGMFIIAGVLSWSMNDLRIGGKLYNQIVSDKDLLADILPPPAYVIESYLTVYQLLDAEQTDKTTLWKTMDRLKSEYEARKHFWATQSIPDNLRQALNDSHRQADQFYQFVDGYRAHKNDDSDAAMIINIQKSYAAHRVAIDELVSASNQHFEAVSREADDSLSLDVWIVISVLLIVFVFSLQQGWTTLTRIMRPITQMQTIVQNMSEGNFSGRAQSVGRDELSVLARQLNALLDQLQNSFEQSISVSNAFAHGNFKERMSVNAPGDMGVLAQSINHSFDQATQSVGMVMSALTAIRSGTLLEDWAGKNKGQMFEGAWREAVEDGERALLTRETVFNAVIAVMESAARGDFSQRVGVSSAGLFSRAIKAIDETMVALESIIAEINRVTEAQSKGDLSATVTISTDGQLRLMKESINHSMAQMRHVVQQIYSSSHVVGEVAAQVSRGAHDLSDRVQEQASALEETTSSIHEMSHAVQSNAENARSASQLVSEMKFKAEAGVDVMKQTIGAMSAISESSHRIADIVSLIDGIAFQTNLLALNAAVEAARAGEHGRGFAVVASEVRALAGKSSDAAKDIRGLIQDSVNRVDMGKVLADQSGEMLHAIQQEIALFSDSIEQIARASAEQTLGIRQVNLAIANIDKATQENAALVEETTAAAESMASEANNLRQQVSIFRLSEQGQLAKMNR
jgi:methyl-accepting chemotaxis protein